MNGISLVSILNSANSTILTSSPKKENFSFEKFTVDIDGYSYDFYNNKKEDGINIYGGSHHPTPGSFVSFNANVARIEWSDGRTGGTVKKNLKPSEYKKRLEDQIKKIKERILPHAQGKNKNYLNEVIVYLKGLIK